MPDGRFELLQVASEIEPVIDLYRQLAPRRVLEIGCWDGGSIQLWLENSSVELLAAVDLNHWNRDAYQAWSAATEIVLHTGSSLEQDAKDFIAAHAPYDWVMIDGDHSDEAVRSDYAACAPHVRKGGVVLLHDITPASGSWSTPPRDLLNELSAEGLRTERFEEINDDPWTHGLGVVYL